MVVVKFVFGGGDDVTHCMRFGVLTIACERRSHTCISSFSAFVLVTHISLNILEKYLILFSNQQKSAFSKSTFITFQQEIERKLKKI